MPYLHIFLGLCFAGLACATCPSLSFAQSSYDLRGHARSTGLAHATTALATDVGVHANPAARSASSKRELTLFARQSFGLEALRYGAAHWVRPSRVGSFSMGAGTFGTDAYREVHLNAGYARAFSFRTSRRLHAGVNLRYYHTRVDGYGQAGALGVHLGLLVEVLPGLDFGAHATNVNQPALVEDDSLPRTLAVGLSYEAERRVRIVADVFKDVAFPLSMRGGLEVRPVEVFQVRAGVASNPTRFTAGAGVSVGALQADLAAEQHQELGWSPAASFGVQW